MAREQTADGIGGSVHDLEAERSAAAKIERELEVMRLMGKRNLDAVWAINRLAVDCVQRCAERQTDVWAKFSNSALNMLGMFSAHSQGAVPPFVNSPAVAEMIETILNHMREVSETIARANQDALEVVSSRSEACFKEVEETAKRTFAAMLDAGTAPAVPVDTAPGTRERKTDPASKG